ncbi:MAG: leucine-rich repeat domain-containing protein [Promethearchaeota archaeon]
MLEQENLKKFKVNAYITLKLKGNETVIYIAGEQFGQCKFLLLDIPIEKLNTFDGLNSIDEAAEMLDRSLEQGRKKTVRIPPETEFWGHCSNLQVWDENFYDSRLLHRSLAFPLLKRLAEIGDPKARRAFKDEVARRLESDFIPVILFIIEEEYLKYFTKNELISIIQNLKGNFNEHQCEDLLKQIFRPNSFLFDTNTILFLLTDPRFCIFRSLTKFGKNYQNKGGISRFYEFLEVAKKEFPKIVENEIIHVFKNCSSNELLTLINYRIFDFGNKNREEFRSELIKRMKIEEPSIINSLIQNGYTNGLEINDFEALIRDEVLVLKALKKVCLECKLRLLSDDNDFYEKNGFVIKNDHIIKLNLVECGIKMLPDSIDQLKYLEMLFIGGNNISKLPSSIGNLKSLKQLRMEENQIKELPESIGNLTFLEILHANNNKITHLPKSFFNLKSLKKLYLKNNYLEYQEIMNKMESLKDLI